MKQRTPLAAIELPEGALDTEPLASPFLDFIGWLTRSPCRKATRIAVSTCRYKSKAARALSEEAGYGSS